MDDRHDRPASYHLSKKMASLINFAAYILIGEDVKFGRHVKFTVDNELLSEYEIAGDVQKLSELFDRIQDKSNRTCLMDLLGDIQSSLDTKPL